MGILLLPRLPTLKSGYTVAAATRDMGPVAEILWLVSASLDLAVRYEQGWAAIIWSGSMQRESSLLSRLHDFGSDMVELSSGPEPAWPGLITIIVGDEWQREIATWVVESFGDHLRDRVSVWCVADGARTGAVRSLDSRGWIRQYAYPRDMGGWSWEARLAAHRGPSPARLRMGRIPLSAGRRMAAPSPPASSTFWSSGRALPSR